jgi:hypothetical protein
MLLKKAASGRSAATFSLFLKNKPSLNSETFEKCSILFKFKEDEDFNHRNTLSISRIEL